MSGLFASDPTAFKLLPMWEHQREIYDATRAAIVAGNRKPFIPLATGGGKTNIAAHIFASALRKGGRCLFTVPRLSLIDKTVEEFRSQGLTDIGVIQGSRHALYNPYASLQVASMATLIRRPDLITGYAIVMVDEARIGYDEFYKVMDADTKTVYIGLDATPGTIGLGRHWDCLISVPSNLELQRRGIIVPFRVYQAHLTPDRSKVKTRDGEFVESAAVRAMGGKELIANVYDEWVARGSHAYWFVFGQTCAHTQEIMAEFQSHGVSCGYIDANTPPEERKNARKTGTLDLYTQGTIHVMFSVGCLGMGVDVKVYGVTLAYITKSWMKLGQDMGRGARKTPGKDFCWCNDHGGNIKSLGMPEDFVIDRLDTRDPKETKGEASPKEAAKPRQCPGCQRILPARVRVCPDCGAARALMSDIVTIDGELVERGKESVQAKTPKPKKPKRDEKVVWWSSLQAMVRDGKLSDKGALAIYKKQMGVWPRGMDDVKPAYKADKKVSDFVWADRKAYKEAREKRA